ERKFTARGRALLRYLALVALGLWALLPAGASGASGAAPGTVVAWSCITEFADWGQCNVPSGLSGVTEISAGWSHSLGLKQDGTVVAWGCGTDDFGQCKVRADLRDVIAIAAGDSHSLALEADGTVVAWGCNGMVGECIVTGLSGVIAISAGYETSLAVKADG